MAWPGWFSLRFLVSMFPMVLLAFGRGADRVGQTIGPRVRLGTAAVAFALACNLAFTAQVAWHARRSGWLWGDPVQKADLDATLGYVRDHLPAEAVVVSMTPEMVYLHTGRQGFLLMPEDDRALVRLGRLDRLLEGMTLAPGHPLYFLGPPPSPDGPLEARQVDAYARREGLSVEEVFRSAGGRYWVARVIPMSARVDPLKSR